MSVPRRQIMELHKDNTSLVENGDLPKPLNERESVAHPQTSPEGSLSTVDELENFRSVGSDNESWSLSSSDDDSDDSDDTPLILLGEEEVGDGVSKQSNAINTQAALDEVQVHPSNTLLHMEFDEDIEILIDTSHHETGFLHVFDVQELIDELKTSAGDLEEMRESNAALQRKLDVLRGSPDGSISVAPPPSCPVCHGRYGLLRHASSACCAECGLSCCSCCERLVTPLDTVPGYAGSSRGVLCCARCVPLVRARVAPGSAGQLDRARLDFCALGSDSRPHQLTEQQQLQVSSGGDGAKCAVCSEQFSAAKPPCCCASCGHLACYDDVHPVALYDKLTQQGAHLCRDCWPEARALLLEHSGTSLQPALQAAVRAGDSWARSGGAAAERRRQMLASVAGLEDGCASCALQFGALRPPERCACCHLAVCAWPAGCGALVSAPSLDPTSPCFVCRSCVHALAVEPPLGVLRVPGLLLSADADGSLGLGFVEEEAGSSMRLKYEALEESMVQMNEQHADLLAKYSELEQAFEDASEMHAEEQRKNMELINWYRHEQMQLEETRPTFTAASHEEKLVGLSDLMMMPSSRNLLSMTKKKTKKKTVVQLTHENKKLRADLQAAVQLNIETLKKLRSVLRQRIDQIDELKSPSPGLDKDVFAAAKKKGKKYQLSSKAQAHLQQLELENHRMKVRLEAALESKQYGDLIRKIQLKHVDQLSFVE